MFEKYPKNLDIKIGKSVIHTEVANTLWKKTLGLMGRKSLEKNAGMLFVFGWEQKPLFWMFNTPLPLDIIWIDKNKNIVDITKGTTPWKEGTKLKTLVKFYSPTKPIKYALEVTARHTTQNNIEVGMKIYF